MVVVVGAGVIGLSCAVMLADRGQPVRLVSAEPVPETTSGTAGAIFGPYRLGPPASVLRWSERSLREFVSLAAGAPRSGVRLVPGIEVVRRPAEPPGWLRSLLSWRMLTADELRPGFVSGWRYVAPLIDMPRYLDYLLGVLRDRGVEIATMKLRSLDEVEGDLVVNCTGFGARELVGDGALQPVRGRHVVVENPGIDEFYMEDVGGSPDLVGIYPHGDRVVLGGTADPGCAERTVDAAVSAAIVGRAAEVFPALGQARILAVTVGVRPIRTTVRLQAERLRSGRWCVHNYGHGGGGVTVSWGCAADVIELVTRLLSGTAAAKPAS